MLSEKARKASDMTPEQERHLQRIKDAYTQRVDTKYREGQQERGGNLFSKAGMANMLEDEIIDLPVYFFTLRDQLKDVLALMRIQQHKTALIMLESIVEGKGDHT